jgi:hypothetical protein
MVVQENNLGGIKICVDLRKLNDAFLHDPFPTPFTNKVLENVGGQEAYSFIDGFSSYHQIRIAPEDRHKTIFFYKVGLISVYSYAIWIEECTNHFFKSSSSIF